MIRKYHDKKIIFIDFMYKLLLTNDQKYDKLKKYSIMFNKNNNIQKPKAFGG